MRVKINSDGTNFTNARILDSGMVKTVIPTRNAVIIDYYEKCDDEGNPYIDRVVSIECREDHMNEFLLERARKILTTL